MIPKFPAYRYRWKVSRMTRDYGSDMDEKPSTEKGRWAFRIVQRALRCLQYFEQFDRPQAHFTR